MPNLDTTRKDLSNLFTDGWNSTTPIVYDNIKSTNNSANEFVEVRFVVYDSNNIAVGSQDYKAIRHTGVFAVVINVELNNGSGNAWRYADQIKDFMSNKQVSSGLFTLGTEVRRNGDTQDGYFSLICDTRYSSDEF